jgi:hypothetical protein
VPSIRNRKRAIIFAVLCLNKYFFFCIYNSYTIRRLGETSQRMSFFFTPVCLFFDMEKVYNFPGAVPPAEICLVFTVLSRTCNLGEACRCLTSYTPLRLI